MLFQRNDISENAKGFSEPDEHICALRKDVMMGPSSPGFDELVN